MTRPWLSTFRFAFAVRTGRTRSAIALMPHIDVARAERMLVWRPRPLFLFGQFLEQRQWDLALAWIPLYFDQGAADLAKMAGMPTQKGIQAIDDWLVTALVAQLQLAREHPETERPRLRVAHQVLRACQAHGLNITVECRNPKLDALPTFFQAILPNVRTIQNELAGVQYPFAELDAETGQTPPHAP